MELVKKLEKLGYTPTRQTGSHIRLSCSSPTEAHITVPMHDALRIGTLSSILQDVATQQKIPREQLVEKLFG